ncbi:MAG: hypothetical protein QG600_78, partial [Patescibacteria group bacterium]|nr:hypothetical protein [Patescibacteria group bacterium]
EITVKRIPPKRTVTNPPSRLTPGIKKGRAYSATV